MLYVDWYRWEDNWEARWARSGYSWITQPPPPLPPNSQKCTFVLYCGPYTCINKAIRDGRPRPPRHQVGWDIPLHFDTNPESLRPFVPEIWPNNVFNLSATYDLDLWPKILKIFVSHGVPIRNMYAKFHNDRLRNGWDITRTNKHTNTQTHKQTNTQTDMGITIPRPPPMGGEVKTGGWKGR